MGLWALHAAGSLAFKELHMESVVVVVLLLTLTPHGVSENRGSYYSTINSRILIIRTPK